MSLSIRWFVFLSIVTLGSLAASSQTYKPGEVIEYKASNFPEQWERGQIIREIPGGTQYLVREKPSQFFPEGFERAYALDAIRKPQAPGQPPAASKPAPAPTTPVATPSVSKPAPPTAPVAALPPPQGLLGKEHVIAYARQVIGPEPWGPNRDKALEQIRDYIKRHGTSFTTDDDFNARMSAQSTSFSHIAWAVNSNHGQPPKVSDYVGRYELTAASRGTKSYERTGSNRVRVTTTDAQAKSGRLEIKADGTYVWDVLGGDPPEKWLRGKWREVKPEENQPWEGGAAIWLEKAKQGYDCMVRMDRTPGWPGWIEVGMGKARTPVEYGKKQ
jgi:hypothetical protein